MRTKEFIASVQNMGFKIAQGVSLISVKNELNETLAYVDEEYTESMSTVYRNFVRLADEEKENLFKVIVEYASTPLEEREEEKKFYLRFKEINDVCGNDYLNLPVFKNSVVIGNKIPKKNYKTIFTERDMGLLPYSFYQMIMQGHLVKEELE